MAVSSAEYFEARWRVQGSGEAWSSPRRVSPVGEIVVQELERDKTYEFQVRSVSNCGAKSIWVSGAHSVPSVASGTLTLDDLLLNANNAAAQAQIASDALAKIASDRILSANEKPIVIRDYNVIIAEQPGIDAQAVSFLGAASVEQVAYDDAITDLTNHLATLLTPTKWNNTSGDTNLT